MNQLKNTNSPVILIADDDRDILSIIETILQEDGYQTLTASDGEQAVMLVQTHAVQLLILDIMMPKMNGLQAATQIRRLTNAPILMLSAKGEQSDRVIGLNMGADDYLVKPFGMMEMVSRIKAVLRRCEPVKNEDDIVSIGDIVLNDKEHIVTAKGENVNLTFKEYKILKLFMNNPDIVFSRDKLLSEVWGVDYLGESRTVDMHIKTLRQKLGEAGAQIKTVIGVGYKLGSSK